MVTTTAGGGPRKRSREFTERRILDAARGLFASHGIDQVSVREIARVAGVDHALVHRYFGSKAEMAVAIIRTEGASILAASPPPATLDVPATLQALRAALDHGMANRREATLLIIRAVLDGLAPESLVADLSRQPAAVLARWIGAAQQAAGPAGGPLSDPALVSAVVMGALYSLIALDPWLTTVTGLSPGDLERRRGELIDILIDVVARAAGVA